MLNTQPHVNGAPSRSSCMKVFPFSAAFLLAIFFSFAPILAQPSKNDDITKDRNGADSDKSPIKSDGAKLPSAVTKPLPESVTDLKIIQEQTKKVVAKVTPCVVGVQIDGASGSGVIVSKDGIVLTAGHVSGKPGTQCRLILPDGKRLNGKSLGANPGIDSGMIQITTEGKWNYCEIGRSDNLKPGQWCIAIGHPNGFQPGRSPVVRVGRILSVSRTTIATDCTLVGGDSGGPLFDMEGKVIGIHSRIGGSISSNIHVPIKTYSDQWDRLVKSELIGVSVASAIAAPRVRLGVVQEEGAKDCRVGVTEDSLAEKTGLKSGDVVTKFDGKDIKSYGDLISQLAKKKPGDEVEIIVKRGAEIKSFVVKFPGPPVPAYLGVMSDSESNSCKLYRVTENSPAEKAGLKAGDVITKFDGKAVKTYDDMLELLDKKKPGDEVEIVVKRGDQTMTLKATLGKRG